MEQFLLFQICMDIIHLNRQELSEISTKHISQDQKVTCIGKTEQFMCKLTIMYELLLSYYISRFLWSWGIAGICDIKAIETGGPGWTICMLPCFLDLMYLKSNCCISSITSAPLSVSRLLVIFWPLAS